MFQNAAVEVAIALMLMYLMLSLLCTVINEFIAAKMQLRAKSLESALKQLLDDKSLREKFYGHGLIVTSLRTTENGLQSTWDGVKALKGKVISGMGGQKAAPESPTCEKHPSYLSGRSVALALLGSLDTGKTVPGIPEIKEAVEKLQAGKIRDSLLSSLTEAGNDIDKLRASIATWFDDSMDRLSGAYKRKLKWVSMVVGLFVAISFNADTINVAKTLWTDRESRSAAVAVAAKLVDQETLPSAQEADGTTKLQAAIKNTQETLRPLPIGWRCGQKSEKTTSPPAKEQAEKDSLDRMPIAPTQILGWLLTAAALTLGAPFWFDLLQKFVNLRAAGTKPKREDGKSTTP